MADLLRRCDRNRPHRVDACSIFWTLGGKQVGRATISGWRDVLAPALRHPDLDVAIWLFDGELDELLRERDVVIVETYPAEACLHLGFKPPGQGWSKRKQADRRTRGEHLLAWARKRGLALSRDLERQIEDGFGATSTGDDRFDAAVGLMSMVEVVLGHREPGAPVDDPYVRTVENWIFGQSPSTNDSFLPLSDPRVRAARPGDEEAIDRLLEQLFAGHSDVRADPAERREALPGLIASDRLRVLVVEDDAGVVGMISFSFNLALRYAGEYAQIEELIVDPRGRGRQLGALLVRAAIAEARARGCRETGLYAREETRAFYEKLGFRYAGPEVRMPLG